MPNNAVGQNLILNGNFENYYKCPTNIEIGTFFARRKELLPNWNVPTKASPDYFNTCGKNSVNLPNTLFGELNISGDNHGVVGLCMGFAYDTISKFNYREYLQTEFVSELKKDSIYCLEVSYCFPPKINYSIKEIGFLFTSKKVKKRTNKTLEYKPSVVLIDSLKKGGWVTVKLKYKATGEEKFLTFGNFNDGNTTKYIKQNNIKSRDKELSYCFFDNIKLYQSKKEVNPIYDIFTE